MRYGKCMGILIVSLFVLLLGTRLGYYTRSIFQLPLAEWIPTEETVINLDIRYGRRPRGLRLHAAGRRKILPAAL